MSRASSRSSAKLGPGGEGAVRRRRSPDLLAELRHPRRSSVARIAFRVERQILIWPSHVGIARLIGLWMGLGVALEVITYPLVPTGLDPARTAVTATGAVIAIVLLGAPSRYANRATTHAVVLATIGLQGVNAALTGGMSSPHLSGFVAIVLVVALYASRRMVTMTFAATGLGLLAVTYFDAGMSWPAMEGMTDRIALIWLAGSLTSIVASRQRRTLLRTERRLRRGVVEVESRRVEALIDPLTGVGNRRAFERDLDYRFHRAGRQAVLVAIADADGLKNINDGLGHAAGDLMLRAIAASLRSKIRAEDGLYRVGGDEFAVLVSDGDVAAVEARLGDHVEAEVPELGLVRASVGVASGDRTDDPATIVALADRRMYETKRRLSLPSATPSPGSAPASAASARSHGPT